MYCRPLKQHKYKNNKTDIMMACIASYLGKKEIKRGMVTGLGKKPKNIYNLNVTYE
jgi:hypothetical protein